MASKKFSEFASAATWGAGWYVVGYNPAEGASVDANKRVPYSAFTDTFALKATFDAHAADQTLHLSAAQNAGLDASSSPSAVNPYLTESAGDARYPDATAQAAKDSGQDAAISQNATDILGTVVEVQAGTYIASIDNTDPRRPIINAQEQASPGGGEANVGENLGTGAEVYAGMNALALTLRTMVNTGTVEWTQTATGLSASVPGGVFDADGSAAAVDSALTTHKSSGDHDARYIQDAPSDGTPYARKDAGWTTILDDGLPAGGTTGQHLAKTSDTSYDTEWVNAASGGAGDMTKAVYDPTAKEQDAFAYSGFEPDGAGTKGSRPLKAFTFVRNDISGISVDTNIDVVDGTFGWLAISADVTLNFLNSENASDWKATFYLGTNGHTPVIAVDGKAIYTHVGGFDWTASPTYYRFLIEIVAFGGVAVVLDTPVE